MSYFVFSSESVPHVGLMGKPGYTPEYIVHSGIQLPNIPANKWMELPESFSTLHHKDWRDRAGEHGEVSIARIVQAVKGRWAERGVMFLDHEPSPAERVQLERQSFDANRAFRMRVIEAYENQVREREITGIGRTWPTPYEDECYAALGLTKPYSVEAMRAQRHPGEAVGEQIVAALERLEKRRASETPTR